MTEEKAPEFKGVKVVKPLGKGSFGSVYEVIHDGEVKALKVYRGKMPGLIEIDTLSRIRHPNIIAIQGVLNQKEFASLMPLADIDLADYLVEQRSVDTRVTILYKIVSAVDFLLDQNILPFDLHSGNVVMMGDEPLIIDTGLARRIDCRGTVLDLKFNTPMMRSDIRPLENMRGSEEYSEASIVWGLGILAFNILTSGYSPQYDTNTAKNMGIKDDDRYRRWIEHHLNGVARTKLTVKTLITDVKDEKQREMMVELVAGMLNPDLKQRLSIKDVLQHPLFAGQKSHPMGTVVSSDFTVYPEMEKDITRIVKAMLDDINYIETTSPYKIEIPIPSSAIFGAVYVYQRFISLYGRESKYRLAVPLQLMYNLYGFETQLKYLAPSLVWEDGTRLSETKAYMKDIVTKMGGIIHPITDYEKAYTKLSHIFPAMVELSISDCPKPSFREVSAAILSHAYDLPTEMKLVTPLYYTVKSYRIPVALEEASLFPLETVVPDISYYRYEDTHSELASTIRSLFGKTILDPTGGNEMYYADLSPVDEDIVEEVFNEPRIVKLDGPPKQLDGEIVLLNLW